ncbi:unnamed protein product [Periconia digitata]|uniref:Actin-like ATPase domain-containing protein n=1 Tax=Periconia digitata TaxID=1303443 RepID=A0A9W4U975_9PLEO|nr:unnamed protein product [Periconia digitata]
MASYGLHERRLVIGLDYGTTFTGVAFATPYGRTCTLEEIDAVAEWGAQMDNLEKVPSVISYSAPTIAMEQQWGSSLSPNATAMVHTKLELDPSSLSDEMDLVLQSLDGMKNLNFRHIKGAIGFNGVPAYTYKSPEEIVTDYLAKVFQYLLKVVEGFSYELRSTISTDIVVTIPTGWSYSAMNSTFRALTNAGFNQSYFPRLRDVIFVTESEAAAIYTARYLKSQLGREFLKVDESFVLCDAGGGTVDVVSYTVTQLNPSLQLEKLGEPTGRKCGSVFINMHFKKWLRDHIGEANYKMLDPNMEENKISSHSVEGKAMRELMKEFDDQKQRFDGEMKEDIRIDLPHPLQHLSIAGKVNKGEIAIPWQVNFADLIFTN